MSGLVVPALEGSWLGRLRSSDEELDRFLFGEREDDGPVEATSDPTPTPPDADASQRPPEAPRTAQDVAEASREGSAGGYGAHGASNARPDMTTQNRSMGDI